MVRVCDAIMGSGKSSAAMTYMNEHPDKKFIYITPYLKEAERIKDGCKELHFQEPSDKIPMYHFSKSVHTRALLEAGCNVASTHQAFNYYNQDTINLIRENHYTLILDEEVDALQIHKAKIGDIKLALSSEYITQDDDGYHINEEKYSELGDNSLDDLFGLLRTRVLVKLKREGKYEMFGYWMLPPDLFTAFEDVFILSYMFKGQSMDMFFETYNIPYEFIGVHKYGEKKYRFVDGPSDIPEYVSTIADKIHICENEKLNEIGNDHYAFSMRWFKTHQEEAKQLQRNVYNYFCNQFRDAPLDEKMWGTYKKAKTKIRGKGYTKGFVIFNTKATNDYVGKRVLAYCSNVFMNVNQKQYWTSYGVDVDEDVYALSTLVQWIWRSAIREGHEIWIYIPSRRMRNLLKKWMRGLAAAREGGDNDAA